MGHKHKSKETAGDTKQSAPKALGSIFHFLEVSSKDRQAVPAAVMYGNVTGQGNSYSVCSFPHSSNDHGQQEGNEMLGHGGPSSITDIKKKKW